MSELLPHNATAQEHALDNATARIGSVQVPVRDVWDADTCPVGVLPWLAWAFSVDAWPPGMTEQQQRDAIKASLYVHQHKGTIGAVRDALAAMGVGLTVIEWWQDTPVGAPFTFRIETESSQDPITLGTFVKILDVVDRTKNVRSHLAGITPKALTRADAFIGGVCGVGSEIVTTGIGGTLKLDGTWQLDASQMIDGFKRTDTHTLDGSWSLNGATTLNGLAT